MRRRSLLSFTGFTLLTVSLFSSPTVALASGSLSKKQARDAIRHAGGADISKGSVRVRGVSPTSATEADAAAQVKLAFRLTKDDQDRWHVAEVRTGDRRWEDVPMIANALGVTPADEEATSGTGASAELTPERARQVIADLLGVQLPSDAVRVNSVSALGKSASVEARIDFEFHLVRDAGAWRVQRIRTAGGNWREVGAIVNSLNQQKVARAREEMRQIAEALGRFRSERGFYVEATDGAVLMDQLSPRYLRQVIRIDPWSNPYRYEGTRGGFSITSNGPDGKPDTEDDISLGYNSGGGAANRTP